MYTDHPSLQRDVAYTLEAPPGLLPLLPYLLADLQALGASPDAVCELLRPCNLPPETRVLDLGCGKGALAVALAEAFDCQVLGVDAFAPFVEAARSWADVRGAGDQCRFVCADLRVYLDPPTPFDVVVYAALGDLLGPLDETVRRLRRCVRTGGYFLLDDAFLREDGPAPTGYEAYAGHDETRRRLVKAGDEIVAERVFSPEETRALNQWNTARIRARADEQAQAHPEQAAVIQAYVRRQEYECELLETVFVPTLWLLRRGAG